MTEREEYRRRFYCKMTCEGGSERGLCTCSCPNDCTSSESAKRTAAHSMIQKLHRDVAFDDAMRALHPAPPKGTL